MDVSGIPAPDSEYLCGVDDIKRIEGGFAEISAWALRRGESIEINDAHILLQDTENGAFYQLATAVTEREDVAAQFDASRDLTRCGLYAAVRFNLLPQDFKIFIHYQNDGHDVLIDTTQTVSKEEL